jgi:hypothetical protein
MSKSRAAAIANTPGASKKGGKNSSSGGSSQSSQSSGSGSGGKCGGSFDVRWRTRAARRMQYAGILMLLVSNRIAHRRRGEQVG